MSRRPRWLLDALMALPLRPAAWLMRTVRRTGVHHLPRCRAVLMRSGVFPIRNHFYEPLFDPSGLTRPLSAPRALPGVDLDPAGQLALLDQLRYGPDLLRLRDAGAPDFRFDVDNGVFGPGDADYWYSLIRHCKPRNIIEIGSGVSTRIAMAAVAANRNENPAYRCRHVCVEPFKAPWLESSGIEVLRSRVEEVPLSTFNVLGENDLLFIDSSHVIRPQGDVLFEYLEVLPRLRSGVIVHLHDVFTPRDYPAPWITERVRFWNEQYLLEAFLTLNRDWRVIAALNYLRHEHPERLHAACPLLRPGDEPGSFYIRRLA